MKQFFKAHQDIGLHILWIIVLPILGTWLAYLLTQHFFLSQDFTLALFQKGNLHYGYPFYISTVPLLVLSVWILSYIREHYLIFDLESPKFNRQVLVFFSILSYVLTEYTLNGLFTENKWWLDTNYRAFNNSLVGASTIFAIAHALSALYLFLWIRFLAWLSNLDPNFKVLKSFWKKPEWSESEFVRIMRILYQKEQQDDLFLRYRDNFLASHDSPFYRQHLKSFEQGWRKAQEDGLMI